MIYRICEDTPQLALRIVQPGRSGRQLMDRRIDLIITPVHCPLHDVYETYWEGCELKWKRLHHHIPSVTYPAFDVDDDGNIVFYFDKKLWSLPPGRYWAQIALDGVCNQTHFDIDLCNRPITIDKAVILYAPPCGGPECSFQ